jgi:hypothetical protein
MARMRIVDLIDGAFEVRWMWLPFWLATNPRLKSELELELRTLVALNGITESEADLEALHRHVVRRIQEMFPAFPGLGQFLDGLYLVQEETLL